MKKKYLLFILLFIFFAILFVNSKCYAQDLDEIEDFTITVDPRMNDGSLDIIYEITWRVLDSTTEGPLTWVQIGTPNSNFDNIRAISNNIKSISKYNGSYVRIDFTKAYKAGEKVTFKYAMHQSYMYKISWGKCKYEFTPAWFTNMRVDNLTIKWNSDQVKSSNKNSKEESYLIWNKKNLSKGEKVTAKITYNKSAFSNLDTYKQSSSYGTGMGSIGILLFVVFIIAIILSFMGGGYGGGYYRHRGFYGGYGGFYGGCVHSSCACACAHSSCASSCACACAGSGRAGCSKKDFYGTNLTTEKIENVIKNDKV